MFSGIIQDVGKISSLVKLDNFIRVSITSNIKSYKIGSSICCKAQSVKWFHKTRNNIMPIKYLIVVKIRLFNLSCMN